MDWLIIENARMVTADQVLDDAALKIEGGKIAEMAVGRCLPGDIRLDARGQYLLPGFIDLHCDAIEKSIEPRPGSFFPVDVALYELDKNLAACGVTTIYHSLSFAEKEIGIRSNRMAAQVLRRVNDLGRCFRVKARVHSRFEITDNSAVPILEELIAENQVDLFSFMDHSPGQGQFRSVSSFKDYYGPVYKKTDAEMDEIIAMKLSNREKDAHLNMEKLIAQCRKKQIAIASHDDDSPERICWLKEQGIALSEFPINLETARAAHEHGIQTLLGAPNVFRGQSQGKNLSARAAIGAGFGDILCSDYAPLTLVHAVFALVEIGLKTLPDAVRMTSMNPARAVGIATQTGSLDVGKAADLVLIGNGSDFPRIQRTYVDGREVFRTC